MQEILYGANESDLRHLSLGIRNVNSRLKLIYGEDCGLTIASYDAEKSQGDADVTAENEPKTVSTIRITISDKKEQR